MSLRKLPVALHHVGGDFYPRYNVKATLVPCPDTGYVFLYGGFDENDLLDSNVYLFHLESRTWEVDTAHRGLYREGHLALYLGDGNVLVFGGVPYDEVPPLDSTDDLVLRKDLLMMVYSLHDRTWLSAPAHFLTNSPSGRSRHSCCLSEDGRTIYLSGGLINSAPLADLYSYDLSTGTWLGPIDFVARFDHKIAVHEGKLYSFGGLDGDMNHVTNRITYMNLADHSVVEVYMKDVPKPKSAPQSLLSAGSDLFGGPIVVPEYTIHSPGKTIEEDLEVLPSSFERIWLDSGDSQVKFEVSLPLWGCESKAKGVSVMLTELSSFTRLSLLGPKDLLHHLHLSPGLESEETFQSYQWRHAFVTNDHLYLIGHTPHEAVTAEGLGYLLSILVEVELSSFGITPQPENTESKLLEDFKNFFLSGNYSDFQIIAFKDQDTKDKFHDFEDASLFSDPKFIEENMVAIPVHKTFLLARWTHFRRVINSGMSETQSSQLFVPEPYAPVRALVLYLYTGTVDFSDLKPSLTTVDYSALLILSNLYEISDLRSKILLLLFRLLASGEFDIKDSTNIEKTEDTIDSLLRVWENSLILNEQLFMGKVEDLIRKNWSVVSRSQHFVSLPKALIVKLCQNCFERTPGHTPSSKRDSFDSSNSAILSPATQFRKEHSNSPFTKSFDGEFSSPQEQAGISRNLSTSFPHLQHIPNDVYDL